jgi:hypothetical protein
VEASERIVRLRFNIHARHLEARAVQPHARAARTAEKIKSLWHCRPVPLDSRTVDNTAQARNQFARRSIQNASLGVLVGLMLAWMRFGAMREMRLSSTYLAWVIVSDSKAPNLRGLKNLLAFQQACMATSYLGLLERFLSRRHIDGSESDKEPVPILEPLPLPEAPWEGGVERIQIKPEHWRRQAGLFRGGVDGDPTPQPAEPGPGWDYEDVFPDSQPTPAQKRRGERDRRRVKEALERFSATVSDSYAGYDPDADVQRQPRGRRPGLVGHGAASARRSRSGTPVRRGRRCGRPAAGPAHRSAPGHPAGGVGCAPLG